MSIQFAPSKKMIRTIASGFAASKPLPSSLETLSHRFLQRCSVSGTPKGKGKAGGTPLKKSKMTNKKSASKAAEKTAVPRAESELSKIVDECLNAPAPLRHLTAKQRAREDERAKLGLFSEETLREQKMLKKKAGEKSGGKDEEDAREPMGGPPGLDFISLGLVDADKIPKYELTAEDGKRLAKEYSRVLMRKLRRRQAAESTLVKLKKAAIEALPEHLKAAALVPDMTLPPPNHGIATLTPPIEGYLEKMNEEAARQQASRQKRR